ncbi:MAG: hypothetical protein FWG02_08850 [Holophagaceae bacterium]|nr:hypothetical protein [Holophagaceae bacterium]
MLKLAVIGAQALLGRELVEVLEAHECSVLPLASGHIGKQEEEEGDQVVFAPDPSLLENLDLVILADTPLNNEILDGFAGRILDLREGDVAIGESLPLTGSWPKGVTRLKGRPALEQVLAMVPKLVEGITDLSGVHLSSVARLGDRGVHGLANQSQAILEGQKPDESILGYRAAFEAIPQKPKGNLVEVRIPTFHGDLIILNLKGNLKVLDTPDHVTLVNTPPTSREVAVTNKLLAHYTSATDVSATLILGFDPILWGVLQPVLRILEL